MYVKVEALYNIPAIRICHQHCATLIFPHICLSLTLFVCQFIRIDIAMSISDKALPIGALIRV